MFWECNECGGVTEQPKPPDRCTQCGVAGVVLVSARSHGSDLDYNDMRTSCVGPDSEHASPPWARFCRLRCA